MAYVDGFLAAVPNDKRDAFIEHARLSAEVFKRYGALKVVENWGDNVPPGEVTSFPMAVKCGEDETVVFSWVIWPSKDARETGWAKIMEDPDMAYAAICMVVNPAAGLGDLPISLAMMHDILRREASVVADLLSALLAQRYGS